MARALFVCLPFLTQPQARGVPYVGRRTNEGLILFNSKYKIRRSIHFWSGLSV